MFTNVSCFRYFQFYYVETSSIREAMVHFGMALQYTTKQIT